MRKSSIIGALSLVITLQGAAAIADQERGERKTERTSERADRRTPSAKANQGAARPIDRASIDEILAAWPAKPKAVAYQVMKKYGMPNIAGAEMLVWHENGPWKRTTVFREEVPHYFPKVHTDLLEQVIEIQIPADKLDDIAKFDGAISYHGTTGELAARCDMEAANFLAINLARDIATGKRSVAQARDVYGKSVVAMLTSEQPPEIMRKLAFDPSKDAGQPDKVTIAGAPLPPSGDKDDVGDPQVLAALITANAGEVQLASFVLEHAKNERVRTYAKKIKQDHARGLQKAMQLGKKTKLQAMAGGPVPEMKERAAENMAKLAQQDGSAFDKTFMSITIAGHQHKLNMIDKQLLPATKNPQLKAALTEARQTIAGHLEMARQMEQGDQVSRR